MNKFTWLDAAQRKDFQTRWWYLFRQVEKWRKYVRPGEVHDIFCNKKDLEQELIDLEDISLSAYRAMKYLRQYIQANKEKDAQPKQEYFCPCGVNLTGATTFFRGVEATWNTYYCSTTCRDQENGVIKKPTKKPVICRCGVDLTYANDFVRGAGDNKYCCTKCWHESEVLAPKKTEQAKPKSALNVCSCGRVLTGQVTTYIAVYNKYFCNAQCLAEFESGYESESYAG